MITLLYWLLGGFAPQRPLISEMSIRPTYKSDTDISPAYVAYVRLHATYQSETTVQPA